MILVKTLETFESFACTLICIFVSKSQSIQKINSCSFLKYIVFSEVPWSHSKSRTRLQGMYKLCCSFSIFRWLREINFRSVDEFLLSVSYFCGFSSLISFGIKTDRASDWPQEFGGQHSRLHDHVPTCSGRTTPNTRSLKSRGIFRDAFKMTTAHILSCWDNWKLPPPPASPSVISKTWKGSDFNPQKSQKWLILRASEDN